ARPLPRRARHHRPRRDRPVDRAARRAVEPAERQRTRRRAVEDAPPARRRHVPVRGQEDPMNSTATTTATTGPRTSALDREVAMTLAADEYTRFLELLRSLDGDDWGKPTECPPWDVRAMAGHTVGMALM